MMMLPNELSILNFVFTFLLTWVSSQLINGCPPLINKNKTQKKIINGGKTNEEQVG